VFILNNPLKFRDAMMMDKNPIVETIGKGSFEWLSREFNKETIMKDFPDEILDRIAAVNITVRNYADNRDAITSIAVITFAYNMANRVQQAQFGTKDMLLLKVLAKKERLRREGKGHFKYGMCDTPVFELITGEVGNRIRAMRTMESPL
jgi:hypothetical protein